MTNITTYSGREVDAQKYVYIIGSVLTPNAVKIGISNDPNGRLKALQTGSPHPLHIVAARGPFHRDLARQIEKKAHERLEGLRIGGEWFSLLITSAEMEVFQV